MVKRGPGWRGALRRWWLHATIVAGLLLAVQGVFRLLSRPRWIREVPLEECFLDWERCQGDDVYIVGAYAPESQRKTPDCPAQIVMQSPGKPEGRTLTICDKRAGEARGSASIPGPSPSSVDRGMERVIANGYYTLRVRGHLEGSVFQADDLRGGGFESKVYEWRYGDAATREHD
jgi:hypothetical protein